MCSESVLLRNGFKDISFGGCGDSVLVCHSVHHFLSDFDFRVKIFDDGICDCVHSHSSDAHIDSAHGLLEFLFQFLLHVDEALRHFVDIVDSAFSDERGGRFLGKGKNVDGSVGLFSAGNSGHLG